MVDHADNADTDTDNPPGTGDAAAAADERSGKDASGAGAQSVPRWRQIEIMHERAQLRKLLDDFELDFEELEVEVFGSEAEHDIFYRHFGDEDEEEIELEDDEEDDDFEEEEFDELED